LLRRAGVLPEAESILIVRRGPLTALYTYGEARLTGEFIDLFSPSLEESTDPTFGSLRYALLLDSDSEVRNRLITEDWRFSNLGEIIGVVLVSVAVALIILILRKPSSSCQSS
ncbi:hypothetical protein KEJ25_04640, partial [Candidatus Bathyarchaeota archaeon]|nr:hypothetical protein [Candidatus Bathyarchaeota archaeon]